MMCLKKKNLAQIRTCKIWRKKISSLTTYYHWRKALEKKEVLKNRASKKKSIINFQENGRFSISFSSNKKNQNKPEKKKKIFQQNYYYSKTKSNSINPRSISLLLSPYHYNNLLLLFFVWVSVTFLHILFQVLVLG